MERIVKLVELVKSYPYNSPIGKLSGGNHTNLTNSTKHKGSFNHYHFITIKFK